MEVLDHLIVTERGYVTFAEEGIMDDLRSSDTWRVIDSKDDEQIRKMKEDIQKLENNTRTIAKSLMEEGMDAGKISQITGLKISEIKKL